MTHAIQWGLLGAGHISRKFATGLRSLPEARVGAVGSRSIERAQAFAQELGIPQAYGSYQELVQDPQVDVVYVGTRNSDHHGHCLLALRAGKPVLCEKPFCINAAQLSEMISLAREQRLFLMEAMWTRFFPLVSRLRQMLADDVIGPVRRLAVDFGFCRSVDPEGRLFNPALGGGALLDVGVYAVSLASMVFGTPTRIAGLAQIGATGVDEEVGAVLAFPQGQMTVLSASIRTETTQEAAFFGSRGSIIVRAPFWRPTRLTVAINGSNPEEVEIPYDGNGMHYEASEVMLCLREGRLESPIMPLDESLHIMKTLDQLRAQWNLHYPME
jgi:predicted dehydrogenase